MKKIRYAVMIDGDMCEIHVDATDVNDARVQYLAQIAKRIYVIRLKELLNGKTAPAALDAPFKCICGQSYRTSSLLAIHKDGCNVLPPDAETHDGKATNMNAPIPTKYSELHDDMDGWLGNQHVEPAAPADPFQPPVITPPGGKTPDEIQRHRTFVAAPNVPEVCECGHPKSEHVAADIMHDAYCSKCIGQIGYHEFKAKGVD